MADNAEWQVLHSEVVPSSEAPWEAPGSRILSSAYAKDHSTCGMGSMYLNGSPCEPFSHGKARKAPWLADRESHSPAKRTQKESDWLRGRANRLRKNSRIALVGSSREPSFGQTVSKEAHMALRISQSATETL